LRRGGRKEPRKTEGENLFVTKAEIVALGGGAVLISLQGDVKSKKRGGLRWKENFTLTR